MFKFIAHFEMQWLFKTHIPIKMWQCFDYIFISIHQLGLNFSKHMIKSWERMGWCVTQWWRVLG